MLKYFRPTRNFSLKYFSSSSPSPVNLAIGAKFRSQRIFVESDGKLFTELTGDDNKIHRENNILFDQPIVHGMLTASMFSSLFAANFPCSIYLSQSLKFVSPVYYNQNVEAVIEIAGIRFLRSGGAIAECDTKIFNVSDNKIVISGDARVHDEKFSERKLINFTCSMKTVKNINSLLLLLLFFLLLLFNS